MPGYGSAREVRYHFDMKQSHGRRARADTNENLQANLARAAKAVKRDA